MKTYSQNAEDVWALNYFRGFTGTLLEIGANDGITLSNSKLLIEKGWRAHLVEPGKVYQQLEALHAGNENVKTYNFGIGLCPDGGVKLPFYESAAHVPGGSDTGLVSSLHASETERWRKSGVVFEETSIQLYNFKDFTIKAKNAYFDFISIDVEGCDLEILQQIDLTAVGCSMLCIEHNGDEALRTEYIKYCSKHFMLIEHFNRENLIFVRQ